MIAGKVVLEGGERQELDRRVWATTIAVRDRQRAQIILLRAAGLDARADRRAGWGVASDGE